MLTLIDAYNDYINKLGYNEYKCDIGEITFYISSRDQICIHCINILKEEQGKGYFCWVIELYYGKSFGRYIIHTCL
jgi:hypothetical protein